MKEKKINYGLIIFLVVLVILFIPIISDYIKKQNIEVLSSGDVIERIQNDDTFIVYVGELEKNIKKDLKSFRDETKTDYSYDYDVYSTVQSSNLDEVLGKNVKLAIIIEGDVQKIYNKYDKKSLKADVDKYLLANITDENASYKIAKDFKSFKKIIKSDEIVMTVFGRNTCFYCNKFKPVYDSVAEKYNLDIYYFDSDSYDASEYKKVVNLDLTVPAKCSSNGAEFKLSDGFGTPLTIFTKKGKVEDCISGYVSRSDLLNRLKSIKMISE